MNDIDTSVRYEIHYSIIDGFVPAFLKKAGTDAAPTTIGVLGGIVGERYITAAQMMRIFAFEGWTHTIREDSVLVLNNSNENGTVEYNNVGEVEAMIEKLGLGFKVGKKDVKIFVIPKSKDKK